MRLLTKSDFDGVVCASILKELGLVDDVKFVHAKDVKDNKVSIMGADIMVNLPFDNRCVLCFDHHSSEVELAQFASESGKWVFDHTKKSCSRLLYEYYETTSGIKTIPEYLINAVDMCNAAEISTGDILQPEGYVLISFILDARTGLGRFRDFRVSNQAMIKSLTSQLLNLSAKEILKLPDMQERIRLYKRYEKRFIAQLNKVVKIQDNIAVIDYRQESVIYPGNRFMVYVLYPEIEYSVHIIWGLRHQNTVIMPGKSITRRTGSVHIGQLCHKYEGYGVEGAGSIQCESRDYEKVLDSILTALRR